MEKEKVIYVKDIITQAKKEYEQCIRNTKTFEEWDYYRFDLWYLFAKRLVNEIIEGWKTGNTVCIRYRKKLIRLPIELNWELVQRCLISHFWDRVYEIENRIRAK
jgi:hypothetical protein